MERDVIFFHIPQKRIFRYPAVAVAVGFVFGLGLGVGLGIGMGIGYGAGILIVEKITATIYPK